MNEETPSKSSTKLENYMADIKILPETPSPPSDSDQICRDIILSIVASSLSQPKKRILEKRVEIINPQIITTPLKEPEPSPESVEEYHENLMKSEDSISPEDIYGYLSHSIN